MKYNPPKYTLLKDMSAIDVGRLTEAEALHILEGLRWPKGPACPHCGSGSVALIDGRAKSVRDGLWRCRGCKGHFTVMVGTIMEDSHITYRQWVQTFHSMCSHKKGVSALQLQRNLGLGSYRSAWRLAHRIRLAMKEGPLSSALKGTIEVDETYVGGKPRKDGSNDPDNKPKRGRGTKKIPVVVLIERDGRARSGTVESVSAKNLKSMIRENVAGSATIMTDEFKSYKGIGKEFDGGHKTVNHSSGQYSRGKENEINTNSAESYFALLKRGIHGTFHHVSKKHLPLYCDEFSFRWSHRKETDGERAEAAIRGIEGKRLMYSDSARK